jgi:hypothetical protein
MAVGNESLTGGPRLEYVVRKLPGTMAVTKRVAPPSKKQVEADPTLDGQGLGKRVVTEEAGYMVFFPTGTAYRLNQAELERKGFDRQPNVIGLEQANDTKTAAGRFKLALSDRERQKAWKEMEELVIRTCVGGSKNIPQYIGDGYDPAGKLEKEAA